MDKGWKSNSASGGVMTPIHSLATLPSSQLHCKQLQTCWITVNKAFYHRHLDNTCTTPLCVCCPSLCSVLSVFSLAAWLSYVKSFLSARLCVYQGGTNHKKYTYRLVILLACADLLMNSDHKPKLGQSDLVYWVYRISCSYSCPASWASQPMGCLFPVWWAMLPAQLNKCMHMYICRSVYVGFVFWTFHFLHDNQ